MAKRKGKPEPQPNDPWKAPDHLGDIAKECWRQSLEELREIGLLHRADSAALEIYCSAYERYRDAEQQIKTDGEFVYTKNGYPLTAPWVTKLHKNLEVCRRFQMQYGLTPASRAKINVVKKQGAIPPEWQSIVLDGEAEE